MIEAELRRLLEQRGYTVHRYVYPPGTYFPDHQHGVDKIDAVVSGRFRMKMNDREVILGPGEWLEVPRGTVHSAEVVGNEPVVSLDATKRFSSSHRLTSRERSQSTGGRSRRC